MEHACVECKWWVGSRPAEVARCDCPLPKSAERYVEWWGLRIRSVMGIAGDNEEDCAWWEAREVMTKRERKQILIQLRNVAPAMRRAGLSMQNVGGPAIVEKGRQLENDAATVMTWVRELEAK